MANRGNRTISFLLLAAILLGALAPATGPLTAAPALRHEPNQALLLWRNTELWATGGGDPVEAVRRAPGPMRVAAPRLGSARQTEVAINTVKELIAVKEAAYQQSSAILAGSISDEALQAHDAAHQAEMQSLNNTLDELRREWRREKRFLPKLVKPFKQAGAWVWHQLGPTGRSILRAVGNDLVEIIVAGDPVTGQVVRMLLIKHIRAYGQKKGEEIITRILLRQSRDGGSDDTETAQGEETSSAAEELDWDQFWSSLQAELRDERLQCNNPLLQDYQTCLAATAQTASDWTEVLEACQIMRDGLRSYPTGHVILEDPAYFFRDNDNLLHLEYDTNSGAVSGYMNVVFKDYGSHGNSPEEPFCLLTHHITFQGTFSEDDCRLSGTGSSDLTWEGPDDPCFWNEIQRKENPVPFEWEATLNRGHINGNVYLAFDLDLAENLVPAE